MPWACYLGPVFCQIERNRFGFLENCNIIQRKFIDSLDFVHYTEFVNKITLEIQKGSAMRLTIHIQPGSPLVLPLNYQEVLQSFIYDHIPDKLFTYFLHESGYLYRRQKFKLFTFSRLLGRGKVSLRQKKIRFERQLSWQVSSCLPGFVKEFGQSLLIKDYYYLYGQRFKIDGLHYETVTVNQPACVVQMLSPITVHNTFVSDTGHKSTQYFSPYDPAFVHLINQNLAQKYFACYGKPLRRKIRITPLHVSCRDRVITRFKGLIIEAWNGLYLLEGDSEMLTFACAAGLGGRNSSGFGLPKKVTVSAGTKQKPRIFVPDPNLHNGRQGFRYQARTPHAEKWNEEGGHSRRNPLFHNSDKY